MIVWEFFKISTEDLRRSTVLGLPSVFGPGSKGLIFSHSASLRSLGYGFLDIGIPSTKHYDSIYSLMVAGFLIVLYKNFTDGFLGSGAISTSPSFDMAA
jgi:hypothetical protein